MKIVIAGAGFAGLRLARRLNNRSGVEVLLIDRYNYHQFQPLFYQVATAGLDASNISFPLRKVFHNSKNVRIRIGEILSVNLAQKELETEFGKVYYDKLIIATGADTNFFNNSKIESFGFAMKSTVEALQIRHRLIQNFEEAVMAKDEQQLTELLNIVVVGGGATGVELSGAISEMKTYVLPKDYPEIDFSKMNIYLLEGSDKTLSSMSAKSSKHSQEYLAELGVKVLTNTLVTDYDGHTVELKDGRQIPSRLVIWAAGIKGNVPEGIEPGLIGRGNRIKVDAYNRVLNQKDVYAIGDIAYMETTEYPSGHPQVAPVAIQQADAIFKAIVKGEEQPFRYKNKGAMATVGRNLAVVDFPGNKGHIKGFFAWLIWMGLHLMLILGIKNRLFVFLNWLYSYITYDQSLRLVFKEFNKSTSTKIKDVMRA